MPPEIKGTILKADQALPLHLRTIPELKAEIARLEEQWKRVQQMGERMDAAIGLQRIQERAIQAAKNLTDF